MSNSQADFNDYGDYLEHYGILRRSGRYPWGSGKNPYQHSWDFKARVDELKKQGMSDKDVADYFSDKDHPFTTTDLHTQISVANDERRLDQIETINSLHEKGYNNSEIARKMGLPSESSVRALMKDSARSRAKLARNTADTLEKFVDEHGMLYVGEGTQQQFGISKEKLRDALWIAEQEGYPVHGGRMNQVTNKGKMTTITFLCAPGTPHKDIYDTSKHHFWNESDVVLEDNGKVTRPAFQYPESLDSKRLKINYAEDGGIDKDGLIELRRGPEDLSLGKSHYAQVRIMVDGTHYLKGMAVYGDDKDFPPGVDVIFNTNKSKGTPALGPKDHTVLKPIKSDPNNPFGSLIKERGGQSYYDDPNGKFTDPLTGNKQSLSLINKRAEEGDWSDWSNNLPSQFLAKQPKQLVNRQLKITIDDYKQQLSDIESLTNPTVKRKLLDDYASQCDTMAVHLKAAALPRQKFQVILPMTTIKDNQIYAPNFENGEQVALVRYPHGGTFEIPVLTVNNKLAEGKRAMGTNPMDAVGISKKVAEQLSGADFDGDTVMVIPTKTTKVAHRSLDENPTLGELKNFDPTDAYGPTTTDHPYKRMSKTLTQKEMGKISNLIMDMTVKGATDADLVKAVKHSMVVIDAEKHDLDYKRSEADNDIKTLKNRYQGKVNEKGNWVTPAGTIITRAKSQTSVLKRQGTPYINTPKLLEKESTAKYYDPNRPEGALIYKTADDLYYEEKKRIPKKDANGRKMKDSNGNTIWETDANGHEIWKPTGKILARTQKSSQMADTDDAFTLVSDLDNPIEVAYATYANTMKSFANQARKEEVYTPKLEYNKSAAQTYSEEVKRLKAALELSESNKPLETRAQSIANTNIKIKMDSDPDLRLNKKDQKKVAQIELTKAREQVGAKRHPIEIDEKEWEAIQAGAIHDTTLNRILNYADMDKIRDYAMPKGNSLSTAKKVRILSLVKDGYTEDEIAKRYDISVSTVVNVIKGKE